MPTIEGAWQAFLGAVAGAQHLHRSGGSTAAIRGLVQHARELLQIIEDEIAVNGLIVPAEVRVGIEHLRAQLVAVEGGLLTRH